MLSHVARLSKVQVSHFSPFNQISHSRSPQQIALNKITTFYQQTKVTLLPYTRSPTTIRNLHRSAPLFVDPRDKKKRKELKGIGKEGGSKKEEKEDEKEEKGKEKG